MKIKKEKKDVIVRELRDFNLEQTLECGQCFRFVKIGDNHYIITAKNKILDIEQTEDEVIFHNTSLEEFQLLWADYFDLNTDYGKIKDYLIAKDKIMGEVIQKGEGIRILNQDFFETLISFIISQNKQIPQIKQVVDLLCRRFGNPIGEYKEKTYYAFPSPEQLGVLTEEDFRECKAGFRARYLKDACTKLMDGQLREEDLQRLSPSELRERLCTIKGVGIKVANCVLLYGLRQKEAFPVDVWIKRIMENLYFHGETKIDVIQSFAEEKFGNYGGYAQQYLFYYSRLIS
jgi:3-methyladenine DNA glycosylase/8-oxoguanine DNA glycosylase